MTKLNCLTCGRETTGTHCILCNESNSCLKHQEQRDPIAGCMSCLREDEQNNPMRASKNVTMPIVNKPAITLCPDCNKMIGEGTHYCKECSTIRHKEHMKQVRKDAHKHFEKMGSKEIAIERLCAYANANCMPMYDTWLYPHAVEMYGITRADYYNDYDALSEQEKEFLGDNWKPNTENQLENLKADLERMVNEKKRMLTSIEEDIVVGRTYTFAYYEQELKMLAELIGAIASLSPRGGKYAWEL